MVAIALLFPIVLLLLVIFAAIQMYKQFQTKEHKTKETLALQPMIGWIILAVVLGYNIFAYNMEGVGIGLGLFSAILIGAIALSHKRLRQSPLVIFLSIIGIASALCLGFRANDFVEHVNIASVEIVLVTLLLMWSAEDVEWKVMHVVHAGWHLAVRYISNIPLLIGAARAKPTSERISFLTIIKTLIITVAVLIFFGYLLSAADPVFASFIPQVFDQAIGRFFASIFIGIALLIALSARLTESPKGSEHLRFLSFIEVFIPALALSLLFILFLVVQFNYLFTTSANFSSLELTYAEYVHKGFLELLTATFFGSIVVYIVTLKARALTKTRSTALKATGVLLVVLLSLLLFSALKRDLLYMDTYGLTRVRIIGTIFLGWLSGGLILLFLWTVISRMKESYVLMGFVFLSTATVALLNVWNSDLVIATATPPRNQPIDYVYILKLSPDAYPVWSNAAKFAADTYNSLYQKPSLSDAEKHDLAEAKLIAVSLTHSIGILEDTYGSWRHWQSWNLDGYLAHQELQNPNNASISATADCLLSRIDRYEFTTSTDLSLIENDLMYTFESRFVKNDYYYTPESLEELTGRLSGLNKALQPCTF